MKSLILFIIWGWLAVGFASPLQSHHAAVAKLRASGGGSPPPTFLVDENFDGSGTPTNWFTLGSDFDYAFGGSQVLRLSATGQYAGVSDGTVLNHGELYGKFRVTVTTMPSSFDILFSLKDASYTEVYSITINSTGTLNVGSLGVFATTTDAIALNTDTWVYWRHRKSSGSADGVSSVGFSLTETRPTAGTNFAGGITGTEPDNTTQTFTYTANGGVFLIDNFQIATTTFN